MDLGLAGKCAIVTGAGGGLGEAISSLLADEGAHVIMADIDGEAAEAAAGRVRAAGGSAAPALCDVTSEASVAALAAGAGGIDILVNNAGFTRDMRIGKMAESDWDLVVDVILKGAFYCTRAVVEPMKARGGGRIINISSRAYLGNPGQANYSSAKAGLIGFTRAMSLELGRHAITVNAIAPGIIDTPAVRALPHFESIRDNAAKTVAIARMGEPGDIAAAAAFLASSCAGYISGEVLHVTGGRY
ncbi:3-oxoacyl-ACP reductase FabG [Sphingopyxis sp.]|jgi:3-oxoacyl-[acyl-carrier protein] reductase|uniref:3-oxoacyl-ACP reductase FabG n=1 Tax=Sphingopyxis sp. TaxID=1908224 RepID=UPI002DEDE103|nr:3-oxoacyl-ACP reductase FabG [Sphingopyxis sp.]